MKENKELKQLLYDFGKEIKKGCLLMPTIHKYLVLKENNNKFVYVGKIPRVNKHNKAKFPVIPRTVKQAQNVKPGKNIKTEIMPYAPQEAFVLDKRQPEKTYNIYQVIAEYGRVKGHNDMLKDQVVKLEQQNKEKDQFIFQLQQVPKAAPKGPISPGKAGILELLKAKPLTRPALFELIQKKPKLGISSKSRAYGSISELIRDGYIAIDGALLKVAE